MSSRASIKQKMIRTNIWFRWLTLVLAVPEIPLPESIFNNQTFLTIDKMFIKINNFKLQESSL